MLLALWDGNDKHMSEGGSAEVVSFNRAGIPLAVSGSARESLDAAEIGPVIELMTPRMKETSAADRIAVKPWGEEVLGRHRGGPLRRWWLRLATLFAHLFWREVDDGRSRLPDADRRELETWERFEALIGLTRTFNDDAAVLAATPKGSERLAQSVDYLFTDPQRGLDVAAKTRALDSAPLWCRLYAVADILAQQRQAQFQWDWKLLFGFGLVAFFCFTMFTHAGYVSKEYLGSYLAAFVLLVIIYLRAERGQHQERYLDYRVLAEALRVAVYWSLVGIGSRYLDAKGAAAHDRVDVNPIGAIANAYPIKQPNELAWVKVCLRTLERLDKVEGTRATGSIRSDMPLPGATGCTANSPISGDRGPPQPDCRESPGLYRHSPAALPLHRAVAPAGCRG